MIAIFDIFAAAVFGVAVATLFEGRWGPLLIATPLLGLLHGVLFLIPPEVIQAAAPNSPLSIVAQLADPWLLVAAVVASATGSALTAAMLLQSRRAEDKPFWLPDMDRPGPRKVGRAAPDLMSRVEQLPKAHTRRLVEEGYSAAEPQPVFNAGPAPARVAPGPAPRAAAAEALPPEANQRRSPRRRTVLAGRLCADGGISVPCTIRDLSATGAAVKLQADIALPRLVSLVDVSNGIGHNAQVRWRFRDSLGLRFLASFDLHNPDGPDAVALARQWSAFKT